MIEPLKAASKHVRLRQRFHEHILLLRTQCQALSLQPEGSLSKLRQFGSTSVKCYLLDLACEFANPVPLNSPFSSEMVFVQVRKLQEFDIILSSAKSSTEEHQRAIS